MNQPDLTPSVYIKRTQTRLAIQRWTIPMAVCALLGFVPIVLENTQAEDPSGQLVQERVVQAESRLSNSQAEIKAITVQLNQHKRELQAEQHLTERPDWSGVLMLVAAQFDQQLMMTGFQLGDANDSNVRSALGTLSRDISESSVWLILTGVAEANSNVPGLIDRLEKLGLFERVVMTGTQRESFAGGSRTTFTLACRVH